VAFGDTNDTPGYSIALDNQFGGSDAPSSTSTMRHHGKYNFVFVDGHAHTIPMQAGTFSSDQPYMVARPASEKDAVKWCYDPNATSDYQAFNGGVAGYPALSATETCAQVAHDFYDGGHFVLVP